MSEKGRADTPDPQRLAARIEELTGWRPRRPVEVNQRLLDDPAKALKDPCGEGWLLAHRAQQLRRGARDAGAVEASLGGDGTAMVFEQ